MLLTAQVVRGSDGLGFVTLAVHPLAAPLEDRRRATYSLSFSLAHTHVITAGNPASRTNLLKAGTSCSVSSWRSLN